ncbi:MAG: hypothetical protein NVS3B15_14180 [Sediminibacterium sp.]
MKTSIAQKIKVGSFIAAGFGLLLVAIFLIGKQKNLFTKTFTIYASFKNVSGLQTGNFVRFAGINIGSVENISIQNDTIVRVSLQLQNSIRQFIKTDAAASIGSDGLMGDKLIQIAPGTPNAPIIKEGGFITGINPGSMDQIMNKLAKIATNAESLTENLAGIVQKVNHGEGTFGRLLSNDNLARKLEGTISSAQQTVQSIKKGAEGFTENMNAAKSNFLLKGYFKRKERKRLQDSVNNAKQIKQ